uniref:ASL1/Pign fusion protein n=1 Tax=Mus musculus TaxID=10090 RepID=C6EQG4_MOUSE|nr:ASL1/Pign fusion protein [Mus musculus]
MVLFISITCLYVFSSFSVRTSTCLIVFSCFSLRTCNSLAVFSCISLSDLLKSFLMSSIIIMRYAFKSRSRFSGVLGCPGLGEVGVLGSDDEPSLMFPALSKDQQLSRNPARLGLLRPLALKTEQLLGYHPP